MTSYSQPVAPDGHDDRDEHLLRARAEIEELKEALGTNRAIGTAVGIIMERYDLDAEAALGFLKRVSSQHNRKMRELAAELVETRRLPTTDS
ncbi:ANTAR domain-containing protein [Nocardioides pyridinolyticus]